MKGHIVIPTFYQTRWTDDYKHLLAMIATEFKFKIEYSDGPDIAVDTDVVVVFATPHHMRPDNLSQLCQLDRSIKMIGYMKDIQFYDNPNIKDAYLRMFDRYDVILSGYNEMFKEWYSDHVGKMLHFPDFFGPYERYDLPFNKEAEKTCLVAGTVTKEVYPLRQYILENAKNGYVDYLPPPYTGHDYIGDKYAKLLNSYHCAVSTGSIFRVPVAKCFEIPASGCLLICNTFDDLIDIGFEPMVHYVPINFSNATETIMRVVDDPVRYEHIRQEGTEFVRKNHSIRNRFETLKQVINESLN